MPELKIPRDSTKTQCSQVEKGKDKQKAQKGKLNREKGKLEFPVGLEFTLKDRWTQEERESEQRVCELGVQTVTELREVSRRPEACITWGPCVGNIPGKLLRRCYHSPRRSRQARGHPRSGAPAALVFTGVCALHHVEGRSVLRPSSSISPRFLSTFTESLKAGFCIIVIS